MAADPIRFTLVEDGEDLRPYDFSTNRIQIGADASRGDNLLLDLPPGKTHVRAKVLRSDDYIELEVVGGPIWLMGSRMDEGDVAELNVGDLLTFASRADGPTLRFEFAKEAELVLDDVADWSVAAAPKKKRGATAEDSMMFEEEVDPTEGMNPWQKVRYRYREQYKKYASWRKKAARVKYWISLGQLIWSKAGKTLVMFGGFATLGFGWYNELTHREAAEEIAESASEREVQGAQNEKAALAMTTELQEEMRMCGCDSARGADEGVVKASDALLETFVDDTLVPERAYPMPDGESRSMASIVSPALSAASKYRSHLDTTKERVCSARKEKDKMNKVLEELRKHELHEAYSFIPFGDALWCELAISPDGARGMLELTPAGAKEAFGLIDGKQGKFKAGDLAAQREWLKKAAKNYRGYYRMLAKCPTTVATAYRQEFFNGEPNPDHPERVDPADPRTDWEASTEAAYAWIQELDEGYAEMGFREADRVFLTLAAYNQGTEEVQRWIDLAQTIYEVEIEGALTFPQIYAGGVRRLIDVKDKPDEFERLRAGLGYAPKVMGRYLYTKPRLEQDCQQ